MGFPQPSEDSARCFRGAGCIWEERASPDSVFLAKDGSEALLEIRSDDVSVASLWTSQQRSQCIGVVDIEPGGHGEGTTAIRDVRRARDETRRDLQAATWRLNAFVLRHASRSTGRAHGSPAPPAVAQRGGQSSPSAAHGLSGRCPDGDRTHRPPPASSTSTACAGAHLALPARRRGAPGLPGRPMHGRGAQGGRMGRPHARRASPTAPA